MKTFNGNDELTLKGREEFLDYARRSGNTVAYLSWASTASDSVHNVAFSGVEGTYSTSYAAQDNHRSCL